MKKRKIAVPEYDPEFDVMYDEIAEVIARRLKLDKGFREHMVSQLKSSSVEIDANSIAAWLVGSSVGYANALRSVCDFIAGGRAVFQIEPNTAVKFRSSYSFGDLSDPVDQEDEP